MANAPTVQTLDQVMAELNPVYAGQEEVINKQKALIPEQYKATESALNASKVQGFNQINDQATGRGLSFSGIPLDEQATYLSTKYLPGLQEAAAKQKADELSLTGRLADIQATKGSAALSRIESQKSDLNTWNMKQAEQEFTAQQNAMDRAARAAESVSNPVQDVAAAMSAKTGSDGYVSPGTYRTLKSQWTISGFGTAEQFDNLFAGYRNPKGKYDVYTITNPHPRASSERVG